MPRIFICYRREDSAYPAQQVRAELSKHFGPESVVFDVDSVPPGIDFRKYLNEQVAQCDVLLALIGKDWLRILNERRDDPGDYVRIEIEAALKRDIPVVPVLVHDASIPREEDLPEHLAGLAYRNAAEVRAGADLVTHLERLVHNLERLIDKPERVKEKTKDAKFEATLEAERKDQEVKAKQAKGKARGEADEARGQEEVTVPRAVSRPAKTKMIVLASTVAAVMVFSGLFFIPDFLSKKEGPGMQDVVNQLEQKTRALAKKTEALERLETKKPIPIRPKTDSIYIDSSDYNTVELHWEDATPPKGTQYQIVLHSPTAGSVPERISVPLPEENSVSIHREGHGLFFWKVGDIKNNRWSDYASFAFYSSTLQRVQATRRLNVGRIHEHQAYDDGVVGFEKELVQWLAKYLETELNIRELVVDTKEINWIDAIKSVEIGNVDIAVGNITKSKRREHDHYPLTFSIGYLPNHQLLVHKKGKRYQEFPDGLRDKVVAAHVGSINLKAARAISKKYGFVVYDEPRSYADSLKAVEKGRADFAMIDAVRYAESKNRLEKKVECYGPSGRDFTEILREFYERELGQPYEEIAIAVHHRPNASDANLLALINEMLQSVEGQSRLDKMKKRHFKRFEDPCRK